MKNNSLQRGEVPHLFWLLIILILITFFLRLRNLDSFSFWTDESLTPLRSGYSISRILGNNIIIQGWPTKDTHPPLYYLIIHFSRKLLGETDFAFRYPSLLAGVLLVPLLYQFGRRFKGIWMGFTAAFLTTVNPLQIWYANEARMYTIAVLFFAFASYVLWRALCGQRLRSSLIIYLILASLAFYTHYTTVFLITGQSIFWVWLLWKNGQRRLLIASAVIGLLIAIPVIPYTVPRFFTGAEANYFYVPPLIMLQDIFFGFSLGVTSDFALFSTKTFIFGGFILTLGGILASRTKKLEYSFLLVYLLAVVLGLMIGSLFKPMYQGVRHIMLGSPAFLLLMASGFVWITNKAIRAKDMLSSSLWRGSFVVGVIVILVGPAISLNNLYNDPRYVKNDFRSLIHYTESHAGDNDIVIYNNAILLALHEHYQTRNDLAYTAYPDYPQQAEPSPARMASLAEQYERIWFVTDPPADNRDSMEITRNWLDTNQFIVDARNFPGSGTEVKVIVYSTDPKVVDKIPEEGEALSIKWDILPPLAGREFKFTQPAKLPTLWLDLFWQNGFSPPSETVLHFTLQDHDGRGWLFQDQSLIYQPIEELSNHFLLRQSFHLNIPPGIPPGEYSLWVEPQASADELPLGEKATLGNIQIASYDSWPITPKWPFTNIPAIQFDINLLLQTIILPSEEVRPGHNLPMTLYWQAKDDLSTADIRYQLDVIGSDNSLLRTQTSSPVANWLTNWPSGIFLMENSGIYFPPETPPGTYRLRWQLYDGNEFVLGRPFWRPWFKEKNYYREILVKPWPLNSTLPNDVNVVQADFGSAIQLYGYNLTKPTSHNLEVTLFWVTRVVPDKNYFTFVHIVSVENGEIISQKAFVPVNGLRPTKGWRVNEVLTENYSLELPKNLSPGEYQLNVGFFIPESDERLAVSFQGEPQINNQLTLAVLTLP